MNSKTGPLTSIDYLRGHLLRLKLKVAPDAANRFFSPSLDTVKKGPSDLELLTRSWEGKTPENSFLRQLEKGTEIRPTLSCVAVARPRTIPRLLLLW